MLKIGDFSKLSRISIRMLRHYDERGILVPDEVDTFTGYRYYRESQLPKAGKIQALKEMGFSLAVIRELLEKEEGPEEMEQALLQKKQEIREQIEDGRRRMQLIDSTIRWLRKDGKMEDYEVTLKTMPKRYVASLRDVIPAYDQEGILWQRMNEEIAPQRVKQAVPCCGLAIFHDEGFKDRDVDVEIQASVEGEYSDTEHVKFKTVEEMQIASATYKGSYEQLTRVNMAVANWISENGYEFAGASFCIYHVSPHDAKSPDDLVTEVCYPVKKAAGNR